MQKPLRTLVSVAVLGIMTTHAAYSAGFSLYGESNSVVIGNYAAGVAAEASDASIGWYNPAGLVLINQKQAVFSGVGIFPTSTISGTSTFVTNGSPTPPFPLVYSQSFTNLSSQENAFVPAFHAALPLSDALTVGLSMTSPFGLATDWDPTSPVRYEATYSELITTNVSPQFGARINQNYSVGAGLDIQYARVKFNRMIGAPTALVLAGQNPMLLDSLSYNKGSSYGVGFHAGIMGMFNDNHTRLGINYQSKMRHTFYGYSRLTGLLATNSSLAPSNPAGAFVSNNLYSNGIDLPEILTLSGYHDVNETFSVLGSVVFTGWNVFKSIQLNNVAAPLISSIGGVTQVLANSTSPQNYRNTWRVGLGGNYHFNEKLMLRVGGGYDQSPTNNTDRDVRLPDSDRWALAVGAHYQLNYSIGADLGYTHLFGINNSGVNRSDALGTTSAFTVNASTSSSADIVGAQLVWTIDKEPVAPMK